MAMPNTNGMTDGVVVGGGGVVVECDMAFLLRLGANCHPQVFRPGPKGNYTTFGETA